MARDAAWFLYILDCGDRGYYSGISTDVARRCREHRGGGARGAKFTRAASRIDLVYSVPVGSRRLASRLEYRLKRLSRAEKARIVRKSPDRAGLIALLGDADPVPEPTN